jgi:hypothetical protein
MIILKPEPITAISAGAENLLTPSPKEIFVCSGAPADAVDIDLGGAKDIDTIFLGFTNASATANATIELYKGTGFGSGYTFVQQQALASPDALGAPHALMQLVAAVNSRYFRITLVKGTGPTLQAGILMLGKRFQSPHERGGGRQLIDTGTKELLPDGGVGGEDGVILSALKWRFPGLSDAMRRQLWAIAYGRGERKPILVVEEADTEAASANERIHYGTFDRFESYERRDPNDTSWALSMTEWL